jgi:ABC-2 type transport system ATP-binding protein
VSTAAVEVTGLRKRYAEIQAVDGLSFAVAPGEIFGMLGPNGAGKTTTIEIILGLRQADAGTVRVLGMSHDREAAAIKARIGAQLQTTGMYPTHTVREMLELFATFFPRHVPLTDLIASVGLEEKAGCQVRQLSGGQRQRLALALALVNKPEVVFLDEPTTGLDPQARHSVWEIIRSLKKEGVAVLLTTHYMEEAEQLCDRVAIIDRGKIIDMDSPASLVRKHFSHTVIELERSEEMVPDTLQSLAGVEEVVSGENWLTLYSSNMPATMAALVDHATRKGQTLQQMVVRQASLEDVFLKITGRSIRD